MSFREELVLDDFSHRARSSGYEENGQIGVNRRRSHAGQQELEQISLPRADGGKAAWLFLTGSFFIEALIWGTVTSVYCLYTYNPNVTFLRPLFYKTHVIAAYNSYSRSSIADTLQEDY